VVIHFTEHVRAPSQREFVVGSLPEVPLLTSRRTIMRGSLVVLAFAITPLIAKPSRAQDTTQTTSQTDKKCLLRDRGNPSDSGLANRADPTQQGNKDCTPVVLGHTTISGSIFFDVDRDGLLGS